MNIKIGNKLAELRMEHGLSQEELANKIGVSRQSISKWERAEAQPDVDNLIALSKLYKISVDELIKVDDEQEVVDKEETIIIDDEHQIVLKPKTVKEKIFEVANITIFFVTVIVFLLTGFLLHAWYINWLLFLLYVSVSSLLTAIEDKNPNHFVYPVFIAMIYLFIGMKFGLWHPTWVLFITIPLYYTIINTFFRKYIDDNE